MDQNGYIYICKFTKWLPPWRKGRIICLRFKSVLTAWRLVLSMKPWSYIWLEVGLFSTIIAIIRACVCWALFVVTLTNTVHLIHIYIYTYIYIYTGLRLTSKFSHMACLNAKRCNQNKENISLASVSRLFLRIWDMHAWVIYENLLMTSTLNSNWNSKIMYYSKRIYYKINPQLKQYINEKQH